MEEHVLMATTACVRLVTLECFVRWVSSTFIVNPIFGMGELDIQCGAQGNAERSDYVAGIST